LPPTSFSNAELAAGLDTSIYEHRFL